MCTQSQAIEILKEVFHSCNPIFDYTVKDAFLYGSYARGDYHDASDIDILLTVDMDTISIAKYRNDVAKITSNLSLLHDVTVSVTVKSFEHFIRFSEVMPYYKNVLQEGIRYAV